MLNFICATEGVVDALNHGWNGVHRVQGLVRVHGGVGVVIRSDLPTRQVNGLNARFDLLHGLTTGQRT